MNFHKSIRTISLIIIIFLSVKVYFTQKEIKENNKIKLSETAENKSDTEPNNELDVSKVKKDTPKVAIGGDFELINTEYQTITNLDLKDKVKLVYFGFTNCPDICPTDMAKISSALKKISRKKLQKLQPVFISIDPKRDDPLAVKLYLENFHKSFIGLTGTVDQIKDVTKNYKVYSKEVKSDDLDGYLMDHSAFVYLINKDDSYIKHFTSEQSAKDMAKEISEYLK